MIIIEGLDNIRLAQFLVVRKALKLEMETGLRHSNRRLWVGWRERLGLPRRATKPQIAAELDRRIQELQEKINAGKDG